MSPQGHPAGDPRASTAGGSALGHDDVVDCVVVGGEPAALVAALLLVRSGLSVRVVERGEPRDPRLTGVSPFLGPQALAAMSDLGLLDNLLPIGKLVRGLVEHLPDGDRRTVLYRGSFPFALSVAHLTLTDLLREALEGESVQIRSRTPVHGLKAAEDAVTVHTADGTSVTGRVVICAEGSSTRLRAMAGIGVDVVDFDRPVLMVAVDTLPAWPEWIEAYPAPDGSMVTTIPLAAGRTAVQWLAEQEEVDRVRSAGASALRSRLMCSVPGLARSLSAVTGWDRVIEVRHRVVRPRTWSAGRVVLVGDSAHGLHSFAGQGLSFGIQDAAALCALFASRDVQSAFAEYEQSRRPVAERLQEHQLSIPQLGPPSMSSPGPALYNGIADLICGELAPEDAS